MGSKLFSIFKYLDMFGIPPLFTIRGHQTFQTSIGSILTILCFLIMIIYVSYFFKQMIYHTNPSILSSIYNDEIPKFINLTKKNFSFAFGLQNKEYTNYIDESVYIVKGVQTKVYLRKNGSSEIYQTPIKIIKCNEYNFNIIPEYFEKLPLNDLYCLNDEFYEIEGEYKREIYSYIKLNFSKCENSTENNFYCKPLEVIDEYLYGGFIGIFMIDYSLVPRDYNNPFISYGKNLYNSFSGKFFVDLFLYLKNIEIITDQGYFFTEKKKLNFAAYDYLHTNIDHRISDHFLSLTIRVSSKREIHERSYIKIQSIFSNIGGMLKILLLFGEYSIYFIKMTLYKNYILEFFNLDESEIRLKEVREKYSSIRKHLSTQSKINILTLSNLSNNNSFVLNNNNINNSKNNNNNNIHNSNIIVPNNMLNQSQCKNNSLIHQSKMQLQINNKNSPLSPSKNLLKINNIFYTPRKSVNQVNNFFLRPPPTVFENNEIKRSTKTSQFNIINNETREIKKKNSLFVNNTSIKMLQSISIPKTKVRIIKIPSFWKDFLCKKKTCVTIKKVNNNYKEIQFLLDIVHYLKSENTLNIIIKYFFSEEQRKALSYTYTFETDFELEKIGYEYMIKHKKNLIENPN